MKLLNKIASLGLLGAIAGLGFMPKAFSIPYQGNSVYRNTMNGETTVYISGTPNGTVSVGLGYVDKLSSRVAGSCGEVRLTSSTIGMTPTITVDGTTVTLSSLPTQLLPACINGAFNEARNSNFVTPAGDVIITGKTPGSAVTLNIPKNTIRNVNINACGFGTLKNSSSLSIPNNFTINGSGRSLGGLPVASNPPICRSGVGYIPSNWPSSNAGS